MAAVVQEQWEPFVAKCAVEDYDGAYSLASTEMRDAFKGLEGFKSIASGFKGLRNIKELSGNDSGWQLFGGYPASVPDDIVAAGTAPRQPVDCILAFHEGRLQGAYRPASSQPSMAFPFSKAKTDWDIFAERLKVLAALSGRVRERRAPAAVSASSKFWLTGAYIGEFGDPFIKDTELEGNSPIAALGVMNGIVSQVASMARVQGWRVDADLLDDASTKMREAMTLGAGGTTPEQVRNLRKSLMAMKPDDYLMLPTGWSAPGDKGHAIMQHFHKRADGDFDIVVVNTGGGLGYHPSTSFVDGGKAKCAMRFERVPASRVTDPCILWVERELEACVATSHNSAIWYEVYLQEMLGEPINSALERSFVPGHDAKQGDWVTPQRAGICYFKCVLASFRYYLRMRGMSKKEVKRVTVYTRLAFLLKARACVESLGGVADRSIGPAALTGSDIALLRMGIHQTAHHTLKATKRGHLRHDEAGVINRHLRSLEDDLLPACVLYGWQDQGPAPMMCLGAASGAAVAGVGGARGATSAWWPLHVGSGTMLLEAQPDLEELAGGERRGGMASIIDLETGFPATPRSVKKPYELNGVLEHTMARARELAAGCGGVTPAAGKQAALALLFTVTCCRLPVGLGLKRLMLGIAPSADPAAVSNWSTLPVGSAAFKGGPLSQSKALKLAKRAHEAAVLVVELWRQVPHSDVHGIARRNLSVIACCCIYDAALRYAAPEADESPSAVTLMLRGTAPSGTVSLIAPLAGHGTAGRARSIGMPHLLPFTTASGLPFAEVSSRYELCSPAMCEARRLLVEYIDAVRRDCALSSLGLDTDPTASGGSATQGAAAAAAAAASSSASRSGAFAAGMGGGVAPASGRVYAAENYLPGFQKCSWATASNDFSFAHKPGSPPMEQAELAARLSEAELVEDGCLELAKAKLKNPRMTKDQVPALIFRAWLLSDKGNALRGACPEFHMTQSVTLLIETVLEPIDETRVLPTTTSSVSKGGIISLEGFDNDVTEARHMANVCQRGNMTASSIVLGRGLRLSHCDPRSHGVLARARGNSPADEDDVMLATRLDSFEDAMTPEDSEKLLAALTTATLRVPLVIGFFAENRVGALFVGDIRQILWTSVFEARSLGSTPCSNGEPIAITKAPAASATDLSTPRGPLWYELRHSPASTVRALVRLLEATSRLCGAGSGNVFFVTLLFVVRLAARVDQFATAVLQDGGPAPTASLSGASRAFHPDLPAERLRLREAIAEHLLPALATHDRRAMAKNLLDRHVAIMAHKALLHIGDLPAEDTADTVGEVLGTVAYIRVYHSFGAQGQTAFKPSKWRQIVPKSPVEVSGGAPPKSHVGIEAPWAAADGGIRVTEQEIVEIVEAGRSRVLAWLRDAAPEERSRALTKALRIVQQNDTADWDRDESRPSGSRARDSKDLGAYEGGGGKYMMLAQSFELRTLSGTSVQPVPDKILQSPFFKAFFGAATVPYCTISEERETRTTISIINSPSLAGHGELEVELWRSMSSSEVEAASSRGVREAASDGGSGPDMLVKRRGVRRMLAQSGYPILHEGKPVWAGEHWSTEVSSCGVMIDGALPAELDWVAEVVEECVVQELRDTAAPLRCKKKNKEPYEKIIELRGKDANMLLSSLSLFAPADVASRPNLADATTITLLWMDLSTGDCREVQVHRSTCAEAAGTGGLGWAEVFLLQEFARRVYRVPVYSSDARRSTAAGMPIAFDMVPLPFAVNSAPPATRQFRGGDITSPVASFDGLVVRRRRREPTVATVSAPPGSAEVQAEPVVTSVLVPPFFLRGLVPSALLELPLLWWRREAEPGTSGPAIIVGEPAPATAEADTGVVTVKGEGEDERQPAAAEGDGDGDDEDTAADDDDSDPRGRVVVVVRTAGRAVCDAAPHCRAGSAPGQTSRAGLCISTHPLYPGMPDAGAVGAVARGVFGADHLLVTGPQPATLPARLLHDFVAVPPASTISRLRDCVVRAESASHALAQSDLTVAEAASLTDFAGSSALSTSAAAAASSSSVAAVPLPIGSPRMLWGVDLPRLETALEARPSGKTDGDSRFFLADRDGLFLNDDETMARGWDRDAAAQPARPGRPVDEETAVGVTPRGLLAGLPHSLLLRGRDGSSHVFVPSHPLHRPFVADEPFSLFVTQRRGDAMWRHSARSKAFVYSVSVSEGFLRVPSLAAALYLTQCLLAARLYAKAARVIRSVDTDKPLTREERFLVSALGRLGKDNTPDASACRCLVSLSLRYVEAVALPWSLVGEFGFAMSMRDHVRSMCQLSHAQAIAIAEMLEDEDTAKRERAFLLGSSLVLAEKQDVGCGPRMNRGAFGYEGRGREYLDEYQSAAAPTEEQMRAGQGYDSGVWSFWVSHSDADGGLDPSDEQDTQQYLRRLFDLNWGGVPLHLVRLALGVQKVRLLRDGTNQGRRMAPILARCILYSLFSHNPRMLSASQGFPYVIACTASYVNANGSLATPGGEESGFPHPPAMSGNTVTHEIARYVKELATNVKRVYTAAIQDELGFAQDHVTLPGLATPIVQTPAMAPPQPPHVSNTTPHDPLILRSAGAISSSGVAGGGSGTEVAAAVREAALAALAGQDPAVVAHAAAALTEVDIASFGCMPLQPLLCRASAECAHDLVVTLSAHERGVALPGKGLPFDAAPAGGEPLPASFIAESMLSRLRGSCSDWRRKVETAVEPQMRCLVTIDTHGGKRLPSAADLGDGALLRSAIYDVSALRAHLQGLQAEEVAAVRAGVPAVLAIANGLSTSESASAAAAAVDHLLHLSAAPPSTGATADAAAAAASSPSAPGAAFALGAAPSALGHELDTKEYIRTSLQRLAGHRAPISDDMLLASLLSASREKDLISANPLLPSERARAAVEAAGALMLRANRASFCAFCLAQCNSLLGQLRKLVAMSGAGETPSQLQRDSVLRAGTSLATAVVSRREYASVSGGTAEDRSRPGQAVSEVDYTACLTAEEARMDPRFLVFEFLNGWLLRREQVDIVTQFVREMGVDVLGLPPAVDESTSPHADEASGGAEPPRADTAPGGNDGGEFDYDAAGPGEELMDIGSLDDGFGGAPVSKRAGEGLKSGVKSRITQARMGMGKTACVSPLCCLFMANGNSIVTQVVPAALLEQTQSLLSEIFAQVIPKRVVTLDFDRSRADDPVALGRLRSKIEATARDMGVLVTTASALKSMALLFVEEVGKALQDDGTGKTRPESDRKRHFLAAQTMADILQTFGKQGSGRLLLDEVDMLFSPLKSELNYPVSETVLIGPRPERWTLPVALVAAVQAATRAARGDGGASRSGRPTAAAAAAASASAASGRASSSAAAATGGQQQEEEEHEDDNDFGPIAGLTAVIQDGVALRVLQVTPHLVLLDHHFYQRSMIGPLSDWMAWWLKGAGNIAGAGAATPPASAALAAAVRSPGARDSAVVAACAGLPERGRLLLAHARNWVTSLLPHALTKISRVSFGLLTGRHVTDNAPGVSRTRLLTSVPFMGLDVPSPVSEHAHPDVLIGLTALAFAYEGLQRRHLLEIAKDLKRAMSKQPGAYKDRPARRLWSGWCGAAKHAWDAEYGAVAERTAAMRLAGGVPTSTNTGAPDDAVFREAAMGPPDVPPLELLQMEDGEQAREVVRLLRRHGPTARYYLNSTVFPFVCKHKEAKLSASGQELGTDMLFDGRCGFSGTPNDLIPLELGQCDFEPGSEGQFLATLNDPLVVSVDSGVSAGMMFRDSSGRDTWSVRAMLRAFALAEPPYQALIDCGALITGMSNADIARYLLRVGLRSMTGVVYMDDENRKMVIMRGRAEPVPLKECGLPWDKRVTLYDQSHTTGTDIKQAADARAMLTIGKDNTLRDVFQAAWRMRGIGKGQTVHFLITPEVATLIRRSRGEAAGRAEQPLQGLFGWLLRSSIRAEGLMFAQLCKQDLAHTWRRSAFRDLQVALNGADPGEATRGAGIVAATKFEELTCDLQDAVVPALKVFREPVSFALEDPMAPPPAGGATGLEKAAAVARARHGRFIDAKAETRIGRVISRSRGDGAASSSADEEENEKGLSSEMVQEQEQEIEAEQEEDAEREAELAQWYGAPDVTIPPAVRWSIAAAASAGDASALRRAVSGSFQLSSWKLSRHCTQPRGMPRTVLASANWCPQDIIREPEYRVKLAAAILTVGTAADAGPAGVLLSLAEAEAVRRGFHTAAVTSVAPAGGLAVLPSPGLWIVETSDVRLLDWPVRMRDAAAPTAAAAAARPAPAVMESALPPGSAVAAAALFANNEVWIQQDRTTVLLGILSALKPEDRQQLFETMLSRRRERRRAWQITSMRDVFTLKDISAARRRDEQMEDLVGRLARSGVPAAELFATADADKSGRLDSKEIQTLAAAHGLRLSIADAAAVCAGLASSAAAGSGLRVISLAELTAILKRRRAGADTREVETALAAIAAELVVAKDAVAEGGDCPSSASASRMTATAPAPSAPRPAATAGTGATSSAVSAGHGLHPSPSRASKPTSATKATAPSSEVFSRETYEADHASRSGAAGGSACCSTM